MNRLHFSIASVAILLLGTAAFFALSEGGLNGRITLSAQSIPDDQTTVVKISDQQFVVELARTTAEHSQGLSGREYLTNGSGMLFIFGQERPVSFWMRQMKFPLDMIWINNGRVVGVERYVPVPKDGTNEMDLPHYSPNQPVTHVLEVNAGEADEISMGDKVTINTVNGI